MERRCRYIEGSSPEVGWTQWTQHCRINFFQGSERCASLRAQGIDCLPHLDPVFGGREEVEGEIVQIFEVCEEVPLMERSCEGKVSPFSLAIFCILFHQTGVSRCSSHWKKMWWTRSYNLSGCCPVWSELPTGDSTFNIDRIDISNQTSRFPVSKNVKPWRPRGWTATQW